MLTSSYGRLFVVALLILGGAALYRARKHAEHRDLTTNYRIEYPTPDGWQPIQHSPQSLFLFQYKRTKLLLRGATSQIVADVNPEPEMDAAALANFYIDRTQENMPDWKAQALDTVEAPDTIFSLIRRTREGKAVVTAYAVKGNTTLMITLSGNGDEVRDLEVAMPELRQFLKQVRLVEEDMSDL